VTKEEANLRITAMPSTPCPRHPRPWPARGCAPARYGQHAGVRGRGDDTRLRISFGWDILIHDRLREIPRRFPNEGLTLLHLGGIGVLGIMVTLDAEQGVGAMRIIDPAPASHPLQRLHGLRVAAQRF
jgi:hypothetical protein